MHMNDRLSMFRSKHSGIMHNTVTIIITMVLKIESDKISPELPGDAESVAALTVATRSD